MSVPHIHLTTCRQDYDSVVRVGVCGERVYRTLVTRNIQEITCPTCKESWEYIEQVIPSKVK